MEKDMDLDAKKSTLTLEKQKNSANKCLEKRKEMKDNKINVTTVNLHRQEQQKDSVAKHVNQEKDMVQNVNKKNTNFQFIEMKSGEQKETKAEIVLLKPKKNAKIVILCRQEFCKDFVVNFVPKENHMALDA